MATATTDRSPTDSGSETSSNSSEPASANSGSESSVSSIASRLETAATVVWWSFLALVVVFTLIPVVALWFGVVPPTVTAPEPGTTTGYFALIGLAFLGTVVLVAAAIYDV